MNVPEIQHQLQAEQVDGWLLFDHHGRDPIAYRVLGLPLGHVSRRWFYWIPATGQPRKLVHRVEPHQLDSLPGEQAVYASWHELHQQLASLLAGANHVAMQYSPDCMIPYVSLVDAGTVDSIRKLGVDVRSSATLVQYFEARWSDEQLEMHQEAGRRVDQVRDEAFQLIGRHLREQGETDELTIAKFIRRRFTELELQTDAGPIVGVNKNSGDPHYTPDEQQNDRIQAGDFVLIDLWAKLNLPRAVYYDVTWTGYCGADPPQSIQEVFEVVTQARDAAVRYVDEAIKSKRNIAGFQVDDVTRQVITDGGYAEAFVHRTGHSIGEEVHGNGANIDNLETHDVRPIIPRTCFSIEPGIYLPEFGVRSELDCYVREDGAGPTGPVQTELIRIL